MLRCTHFVCVLFRYSSSEGEYWEEHEFGETKITVDGVLSEPGINTRIVRSVHKGPEWN